jgi:predicted DNA-binding transcriptional regulator AlpA
MTLRVYRFRDLKDLGFVQSWAQMGRMIEHYGFPRGRLLTPQVRVWTDQEIAAWLALRPIRSDAAPRGVAARKRGRPRKAAAQPAAGA